MEILVVVFWIGCGIAACIIGSGRGEGGWNWFAAGCLFGPLGVLLALTAGKKCPQCDSRISAKARRCPKCQADLSGNAPRLIVGTDPTLPRSEACRALTAAESTSADKPFCCGQCGLLLPVGSKYCNNCGAKVVRAPEANQ